MASLKIPEVPNSIKKGVPLKNVLGKRAIEQLAQNLRTVYPKFEALGFVQLAVKDLEPLGIKQRAAAIAQAMKAFLPNNYQEAITVLLDSLTPPLKATENNGLAVMFYMPHAAFVEKFGLDTEFNGGKDPFELSMKANYELTQRFTAEFSIRPYIIAQGQRTFEKLYQWMYDPNPHVRRLCSEGTRPRLPWATKIPSLVADPSPALPILDVLKNDPELYVRRSVANHVGDIAKDHLPLAIEICERWLHGASHELKWVIRHALRNPFKKGVTEAIALRKAAK